VIAKEASSQIKNFKAAEVAMLTWAFAVAGLQNKQLMTEIGAQVSKRIDSFTAPQLSHIVWAFGALSLKHAEFLQSLSQHVRTSIPAFKAQGLSNIAWAFAMVNFRDKDLIRRVAPEIARDASDLRPLALARCAWAYRILAVPSPGLTEAISIEAAKKLDDFPTKALVKLVDSIYGSPAAKECDLMHKTLTARMLEVANFFKRQWPNAGSIRAACMGEYAQQLANYSLVDCGTFGTPVLLSQLGVELPSLAFIKRCRSQAWLRSEPEPECSEGEAAGSPRSRAPSATGREEFAVAEADLLVGQQSLRDWVVRSQDLPAPTEDAAGRTTWLVPCDLPGRHGRAEVTYAVLEELCSRIFAIGSPAGNEEVTGTVQMLSTVLPCISCIGAMWQFKVRFPKVSFEFAEQITRTGD